jgi:hypothetical protein
MNSSPHTLQSRGGSPEALLIQNRAGGRSSGPGQWRSWAFGDWRLEGWLEISTPTDAVIWERQQETVLKQEGEADSSVLRREGVVRSSLGIHASILI